MTRKICVRRSLFTLTSFERILLRARQRRNFLHSIAKYIRLPGITNECKVCYTFLPYSGVVQLVARQPLELVILVRVQAPELPPSIPIPFIFSEASGIRATARRLCPRR